MDDIEFVNNIIEETVKGKSLYYMNSLKSLKKEEISDPYWGKMKNLYDSLNISQKDELEVFIKLAIVNAVGDIFSKLDNVSSFANQDGVFELISNGKIINGDLLDIFWEQIECENL